MNDAESRQSLRRWALSWLATLDVLLDRHARAALREAEDEPDDAAKPFVPRLRCRLCGAGNRPLTRHHIVPLSRGRRNGFMRCTEGTERLEHPNNIAMLCDPCHRLIESPEASGGHVHRQRFRAVMTAPEIAFAVKACGREWFDFRYPLAVEGDPINTRRFLSAVASERSTET